MALSAESRYAKSDALDQLDRLGEAVTLFASELGKLQSDDIDQMMSMFIDRLAHIRNCVDRV